MVKLNWFMRVNRKGHRSFRLLIIESCKTFLVNSFQRLKLNKEGYVDPYSEIKDWFKNSELFIDENLDIIDPMMILLKQLEF